MLIKIFYNARCFFLKNIVKHMDITEYVLK